jgi:hypothetical protein
MALTVAFLILSAILLFGLYGITGNTLFDRRMRMNSGLGVINAFLGTGFVAVVVILGTLTILQSPWDAHYAVLDKDMARWAVFVGAVNAVIWLGPQLTGALLLGFAWWVWARFVRDHLYYVIDTRFRHKDTA